MSDPELVIQIPRIALRAKDVAIALGLGLPEIRYLIETGVLPPPRVILRERFWLRCDVEQALTRIAPPKVKGRSRNWEAK
jgi:hypothetical protein